MTVAGAAAAIAVAPSATAAKRERVGMEPVPCCDVGWDVGGTARSIAVRC